MSASRIPARPFQLRSGWILSGALSTFMLLKGLVSPSLGSDEPPKQPVLGRSEPIGSLLIVAASDDSSDESAPPAPIPTLDADVQLLQPVPSGKTSVVSPTSLDEVKSVSSTSDPSQIASHLGQAIAGLMAVGLAEDAKQVSTILDRFQTQHHPRILLVQKQTKVAELQAEIERLKAQIAGSQVSLSIRVIETTNEEAARLLDLTNPDANSPKGQYSHTMTAAELEKLMKEISRMKGSHVLATPRMVCLSGQTAIMRMGREIDAESVTKASNSDEGRAKSLEIKAIPIVTDKNKIRLDLRVETSSAEESGVETLGANSTPIHKMALNTRLEINNGSAIVLGGVCSKIDATTKWAFVTAVAEIVKPNPDSQQTRSNPGKIAQEPATTDSK